MNGMSRMACAGGIDHLPDVDSHRVMETSALSEGDVAERKDFLVTSGLRRLCRVRHHPSRTGRRAPRPPRGPRTSRQQFGILDVVTSTCPVLRSWNMQEQRLLRRAARSGAQHSVVVPDRSSIRAPQFSRHEERGAIPLSITTKPRSFAVADRRVAANQHASASTSRRCRRSLQTRCRAFAIAAPVWRM